MSTDAFFICTAILTHTFACIVVSRKARDQQDKFHREHQANVSIGLSRLGTPDGTEEHKEEADSEKV
jgi:hypothetical protein